jgi:uncharacterized membrane protein HdeD (DUF308 family)
MFQAFLLGVTATASAVAGLFFLRFWRDSRDTMFLAFAIFFGTEAVSRVVLVFLERPNEGSPWIYAARLLALLLILAAILKKNYGKHG